MVKYRDTVDLIRRRTNGCLGPDGVATVYVHVNSERTKALITLILKDDIDPKELTKLAVRYQHMISDHIATHSLQVLPATNYFKKDNDTFSVWEYGTGFCPEFL